MLTPCFRPHPCQAKALVLLSGSDARDEQAGAFVYFSPLGFQNLSWGQPVADVLRSGPSASGHMPGLPHWAPLEFPEQTARADLELCAAGSGEAMYRVHGSLSGGATMGLSLASLGCARTLHGTTLTSAS